MSIRSFEGKSPSLAAGAWVDESAVVIGEVELGADASVWPNATLRGDIHAIRIGARSNIQDGTVIHVTHPSDYSPGFPTLVGEGVTVGHNATLHACTISDYCLVGMGAVVLDGAVLQARVMVGAGALVPPGKVLESGYLYVGSPVKQARPLSEKELAFLQESARYYAELKERHRASD